MGRTAVLGVSNIAEGYGRGRRSEYVQFLRMAYGSTGGLEPQLMLSNDLGYLSEAKFTRGSSLPHEGWRMFGLMRCRFGSESQECQR